MSPAEAIPLLKKEMLFSMDEPFWRKFMSMVVSGSPKRPKRW